MLSFFIAVLTVNAQAQETVKTPMTKADYLQRSKSQKSTGWVLLGVGAVCIGVAAPGNVSLDVLPILVVGGGAAIIGSVFSFMSSAKNKRKANSMSASFKIETRAEMQQYSIARVPYPAISVKFHL